MRTLKRVRIMNLRLDGLKTGEYREITRGEWKELTELLEGKGERRKADQKNAGKHSELGQREPEKRREIGCQGRPGALNEKE